MKKGMVKLDSKLGKELGFTSDKFEESSYLWKMDDWIYISFIWSKQEGKGNVKALFDKIEELGFKIFVPTPFPRMVMICKKRGMKETSRGIGPDYVEGYES